MYKRRMSPETCEPRKVCVHLGPRAYEVLIGRGLLVHISALLEAHGVGGPFALITDSHVFALEATQRLLQDAAAAPFHYFGMGGVEDESGLTVPPGEASKSLLDARRLLSSLARHKVPRSGAIIALGGGVIGDLAGFVAATYLRGVNFVQMPTTLLAMVDSSVGGKTGVNLPEGKNLVGAFHQPKLVVADLDTLVTLPPREFAAGMAEVIKYGAIRDQALFQRVARGVTPGDADLAEIVEKCVSIKARIVENDEFETKGERALLNFGHTIGHAIEKATGVPAVSARRGCSARPAGGGMAIARSFRTFAGGRPGDRGGADRESAAGPARPGRGCKVDSRRARQR